MNPSTRLLTTLLTLSTIAGGASAQQTAPNTPSAAVNITLPDVPNDHWARQAVQVLVSKGIIVGYPDGTFSGQGNITRYEAAMMFYRLLQQGTLTNPAVTQTLTREELQTIVNAIKELQAQLSVNTERISVLTGDVDGLQKRLTETERALSAVIAAAATKQDVAALAATTATKAEVQQGLATKTDTSTTAALDNRVTALEKQSAERQAREEAEKAAAEKAAQAQTKPPAPGQVPDVQFRPDPEPRFSVGGGVEKSFGNTGMGYNVVVEYRNAFGGLGLRATGSYNQKAQSYGAAVHAVKPFNFKDAPAISPYLGLGAGLVVSPDVNSGLGTNDTYGSLLLGVSYNFTDTMRFYLEGDGKFYLSGKGTATGSTSTTTNRTGVSVRAGILISF